MLQCFIDLLMIKRHFYHIGYRLTSNIVCIYPDRQKSTVKLFIKIENVGIED